MALKQHGVLTIGRRRIADDAPAYCVAELAGNHGGDLSTALALIQVAADAGASAVKLQKRDNAQLYTQALLDQPYAHEHSFGPTYGAHRAALEFGMKEYEVCAHRAAFLGLDWFATPFDEASVAFLAALEPVAFKIHSGGVTDLALLRAVAAHGLPVLLSTGGATLAVIDQAVEALGTCPHAILHCTASYPLEAAEANLRCILSLRQRYPQTVIGFSSHSPGIAFSLIAYAFGARIIEHHVTLSRASRGTDHGFSLEPKGLATLVEDLGKVRLALGDGVKRFLPSEFGPIAKMRRRATPEGLRITGELDGLD